MMVIVNHIYFCPAGSAGSEMVSRCSRS